MWCWFVCPRRGAPDTREPHTVAGSERQLRTDRLLRTHHVPITSNLRAHPRPPGLQTCSPATLRQSFQPALSHRRVRFRVLTLKLSQSPTCVTQGILKGNVGRKQVTAPQNTANTSLPTADSPGDPGRQRISAPGWLGEDGDAVLSRCGRCGTQTTPGGRRLTAPRPHVRLGNVPGRTRCLGDALDGASSEISPLHFLRP